MQINVIFFGVLTDLKRKLITNYPDLIDYTYRMAVNQQMVEDNHRLFDNDIVAIMPPFAGG
jgi:molybdopterin synthase sulfur carrier subunit